jgi:hypothetical protein
MRNNIVMKILNFIKYYYAWKVSRFNFFEGLNILGKSKIWKTNQNRGK